MFVEAEGQSASLRRLSDLGATEGGRKERGGPGRIIPRRKKDRGRKLISLLASGGCANEKADTRVSKWA